MGLWAHIKEVWNCDKEEYRRDLYVGEKGSGKHEHDFYHVKDGKVEQGKVVTDEKTGQHEHEAK